MRNWLRYSYRDILCDICHDERYIFNQITPFVRALEPLVALALNRSANPSIHNADSLIVNKCAIENVRLILQLSDLFSRLVGSSRGRLHLPLRLVELCKSRTLIAFAIR